MTETENSNYRQIKERLNEGKLTQDDIKKIEELLNQAECGELDTVDGLPIIARLPHAPSRSCILNNLTTALHIPDVVCTIVTN